MSNIEIILGDCIEKMKDIPSNSLHSVVTDPPYNVSLDKHKWDNFKDNSHFQKWTQKWAYQCFRILRPGGYLISFSANRTYHRMVCGIEDAGFDIKDCINWLYFSGMPKSLKYGRVDKRLTGWSTALKPSCEPAVLAQKPIKEKTVAEQFLKSRTGLLNIDGCRFAYGDPAWVGPQHDHTNKWDRPTYTNFTKGNSLINSNRSDRKKVDLKSYKPIGGRWSANIYQCKKPSRKEKNLGISNIEKIGNNPHPTVKPLKLMRWLTRLVTAKGGTVLDPFCGSGTTMIAAHLEGMKGIGIEKSELYYELINDRIKWFQDNKPYIDK